MSSWARLFLLPRRHSALLFSGGAAVAALSLASSASPSAAGSHEAAASAARDAAYLQHHRAHAPSPAEEAPVQSSRYAPLFDDATLAPGVADVAAHNLSVAARSGEEVAGADGERSHSSPAPAATPGAALYALKALRPGATYVCTAAHAEELLDAVGVVAITRGCHPAVAAAVAASVAAAARADTSGLVWYLVSDSTPDAVVQLVESRLGVPMAESSFYEANGPWPPVEGGHAGMEAAEVGGRAGAEPYEGALPTVLLSDRFRATQRKYVLPGVGMAPEASLLPARPSLSSPVEAAPRTLSGATGAPALPEQVRFLLGAAVPLPSALGAWAARVLSGSCQPTLLGEPAPPGDAHPAFPFLSVVTSDSFQRLVLDSATDVALEAYLSDCPMCQALGGRVRMAAYLARAYFPHVRVAVMNVDDNERPRQWMPGPAFPTIQMYNGEPRAAMRGGGAAASNGESRPSRHMTKMHGPACRHMTEEAELMPAQAGGAASVGSSSRRIGNAPRGSPPCIPSLDFAHPTSPGRMALPTVRELVAWIGANSSLPFDPDALRVPASELRNAAARFPDYAAPRGAAATQGGAVGAAALAAAPSAAPSVTATATASLGELCDDMEVEARVLEAGVFQTLWLGSLAEQYASKVLAQGGRAAGPREEKLRSMQALLAAARESVLERGMYGTADAADAALDAADVHARSSGMLGELRAQLAVEAEAQAEREALEAAKKL